MGNRQNFAKFQENLFRSNEIISIFCPPLFRKRPINNYSLLGVSVNLTTLFLGRLRPFKAVNQYFVHILSSVTDKCPSCISGRRNESLWPDLLSNLGSPAHESDTLQTALCNPEHLPTLHYYKWILRNHNCSQI